MSRLSRALAISVLLCLPPASLAASFTYRGQLEDDGAPADGRYDLRLSLYAHAKTTVPLAPAAVIEQLQVTEGQFAATLDFAEWLVLPDAGWLQVEVRSEDDSLWWPLPDRQPVSLKAELCPESWALAGNALTNPATNFLGTTDGQALELRVDNLRALRIEPTPPGSPKLIGGHQQNTGFGVGAVVAGGGLAGRPNVVDGDFSAIGGGLDNSAVGTASTIGGGQGNRAHGAYSTISGGRENSALGYASTIAGGLLNSTSVGAGSGTIAGGSENIVSGSGGAVVGGLLNNAAGVYSAVGGGQNNCAGGGHSWVGGNRAKVRPGSSAVDLISGCVGVPLSGAPDGDQGTFAWADSQAADFVSTAPNQFLVRAGGGVGINTSNIPAPVELALTAGTGNADLWLHPANSPYGINLAAYGDATSAAFYIARYDGVSYTDYALWQIDGRLRVLFDNPVKPTAGGWAAPSDARLKQQIRTLDGALDRLLALRGVTFEYRADAPNGYYVPGRHAGFVAQEVETVFPEWVSQDSGGYRLVASQGFDALTVEALRELSKLNASLREELAEVRDRQDAELVALRTELTQLRARFAPAVASKDP